jgi:hypothetical protein
MSLADIMNSMTLADSMEYELVPEYAITEDETVRLFREEDHGNKRIVTIVPDRLYAEYLRNDLSRVIVNKYILAWNAVIVSDENRYYFDLVVGQDMYDCICKAVIDDNNNLIGFIFDSESTN